MMTKNKLLWSILLFLVANTALRSQVTILSSNISPYGITAKSMLDLTIVNAKSDAQVVIQAKLLSTGNEVLFTVTSNPFVIHAGTRNTIQDRITISSAIYSSSSKATALRNNGTLPAGKYSYCVSINGIDVSDDYCQDIESDFSSALYLVSPPDKEIIETRHPLLIWTHSESFSKGDNYRMIITEINSGQSSEAAINTNVPVYLKDFMKSHQVQYPIDAKDLQQGYRYAWQVQQFENGVIINKTEAWEFKIKAEEAPKDNKYAVMKKNADATVYTASGNKVFFRFDESYSGSQLHFKIFDDKMNVVKTPEETNQIKIENGKPGYNTYMIDLNDYKMPAGIYLLEVGNEKNETYKLKFIVE